MANKKFYQSLGYKLLEIMSDLSMLMPRPELYREYDKRVHGTSMPSFYKVIYGLEKHELIKREKRGKKVIFRLTLKGKRKLFIEKVLNNFFREKEKRWDGKWRIVIFDVPEKKKSMREFLRKELLTNNFFMIQKSVWITPFKISEDFEKLLKEVKLDFYVRFIVAEYINYEKDLFEHFRFYIKHQ